MNANNRMRNNDISRNKVLPWIQQVNMTCMFSHSSNRRILRYTIIDVLILNQSNDDRRLHNLSRFHQADPHKMSALVTKLLTEARSIQLNIASVTKYDYRPK